MEKIFQKIKKNIEALVGNPAKIYLIIAIIGVLGFVFITPPFQGPDEEAHYNRVQYIAHAHFVPKNVGGEVSLPKSIQDSLDLTFFQNDIRGKTAAHYEFWRTKQAIKSPLNPKERFYPIMLTYNFLTYLPAVLIVAISNLFDLNAVISLYLARLFLAISSVILVYLAIKIIPVKKYLLAILGLLPMLIFQQSMVGTDGVSYAILILFVAYLLKLYMQKTEITRNQWLKFMLICGLIIWSKPLLYLFLPISIILIKKKDFWRWIIATAIVCVGLLGLNHLMVTNQTISGHTVGEQPGSPTDVDPKKQGELLRKNPKRFARVMWSSYMTQFGDDETRGIVGTFGYADVYYPLWMNYAWIILIVIGFISSSKDMIKIDKKWKILTILLSFIHFIAVNLFTYLVYTPYNFEIVYGVQGRYFLPTIIVALLILSIGVKFISIDKNNNFRVKYFIAGSALLFTVLAVFITLQRYFLFTP